jgi:heme exporter protein B
MSALTAFLHSVTTILSKDLQVELRSRQVIGAMGLFALLATMVFYYTLESRIEVRMAAMPAILWVIVAFTSTLGLSRSLSAEKDRGSLDALLLAPIDRAALFYGKFISTWLFALVVAVLVTLIMAFVFNVGIPSGWWLIVLLGTLGLAAAGTLLGSMAIHARGRETTLPILILPVVLPLLAASVSASNLILAERLFEDWATWAVLLITADIVFLALPLVLFEYVVEE